MYQGSLHSSVSRVGDSLPIEGTVEAVADDVVREGVLGGHGARDSDHIYRIARG